MPGGPSLRNVGDRLRCLRNAMCRSSAVDRPACPARCGSTITGSVPSSSSRRPCSAAWPGAIPTPTRGCSAGPARPPATTPTRSRGISGRPASRSGSTRGRSAIVAGRRWRVRARRRVGRRGAALDCPAGRWSSRPARNSAAQDWLDHGRERAAVWCGGPCCISARPAIGEPDAHLGEHVARDRRRRQCLRRRRACWCEKGVKVTIVMRSQEPQAQPLLVARLRATSASGTRGGDGRADGRGARRGRRQDRAPPRRRPARSTSTTSCCCSAIGRTRTSHGSRSSPSRQDADGHLVGRRQYGDVMPRHLRGRRCRQSRCIPASPPRSPAARWRRARSSGGSAGNAWPNILVRHCEAQRRSNPDLSWIASLRSQ